jgi:hypothetical protein
MIKILGAFTRKDGQLAGQLMVDTSSEAQPSDLDVDMFINGIVQICKMDDDNVSQSTRVYDIKCGNVQRLTKQSSTCLDFHYVALPCIVEFYRKGWRLHCGYLLLGVSA